jgi:hypothetical protein
MAAAIPEMAASLSDLTVSEQLEKLFAMSNQLLYMFSLSASVSSILSPQRDLSRTDLKKLPQFGS